jgi:diacylglycerol kinase (ATP)
MLTERAAQVLRNRGWNVQLAKTMGGSHITELARQAVSENADAVFVAGGDGSINHAIAGLVGSSTALGVLPAGTANVWAQELGLSGLTWTRLMALEESARRLATAPVYSVDVGFCNRVPFLLWAGVGLDGFIVNRIEPRSRWEKHFAVVQYAASAVWGARIWSGMNLRVSVDGDQVYGHFLLAVASNIRLYAGGLAEISPMAKLDDGVMDLWLFAGDTLGETVRLALDMLAGKHQESDQARRIPFRKMSLASDSSLYVQLDGEPVEGGKTVDFEVQSRDLRVFVPESAARRLFSDSMLSEKG